MCIADASAIESSIQNPYTIQWDASDQGQIQDGGGDMYDGGNRITTSRCSSQLAPYTDNMEPIASDCFGAGGSYMMDMFTSMMILLSQNTGTEPLTISIGGDLGADGGGSHVVSEFQSDSTLAGFMTSVCAAGDPSVNHLFVFDGGLSPGATHTFDASTNSDADGVSGIGVGSPVVYLLYSSTGGHCHSDDQHRAIFDALIASLAPCVSDAPCISDVSGVEAAIQNPYTIQWDNSGGGSINALLCT